MRYIQGPVEYLPPPDQGNLLRFPHRIYPPFGRRVLSLFLIILAALYLKVTQNLLPVWNMGAIEDA